jgi:DNA anti-recombination protein RmuC
MAEFFKWLPQTGSAGAVILVVYLFLKQQDKMADLMVQTTDKFKTTLEQIQVKNDVRLDELSHRFQQHATDTQEQLTGLVRDQLHVNTRMTEAVESLQKAVVDLQRDTRR